MQLAQPSTDPRIVPPVTPAWVRARSGRQADALPSLATQDPANANQCGDQRAHDHPPDPGTPRADRRELASSGGIAGTRFAG